MTKYRVDRYVFLCPNCRCSYDKFFFGYWWPNRDGLNVQGCTVTTRVVVIDRHPNANYLLVAP